MSAVERVGPGHENLELPRIGEFKSHLINSTPRTLTTAQPEHGSNMQGCLLWIRSAVSTTTATLRKRLSEVDSGNTSRQEQSPWQMICEWFIKKFGNAQDKAAIELKDAMQDGKMEKVKTLLTNPANASLKEQIRAGIMEDDRLIPMLIQSDDTNVKQFLEALNLEGLTEDYQQFLARGLSTEFSVVTIESIKLDKDKLEASRTKEASLTAELEQLEGRKRVTDEQRLKRKYKM
ncbi:MAG: hypothetical protein LBS22_04065 [Puniceicoccales bacterium]|jgi:hypothetical protein|nr:hypothetical protein [Puniceicoccales bacterium]